MFLYFIIENYSVCEKILNLKFIIDQSIHICEPTINDSSETSAHGTMAWNWN